jgi:hypothetical protein
VILKGVPTKIRALIIDAEGEPKTASKSATVTITRDSTGATVVSGASAGETDANGIVTYELAAQTELDRLTAKWVCDGVTVETVEEIVGLRLCSLADVVRDLSSEPEVELQRVARNIAERFLEDECGVAFRPRYGHEKLDGSGTAKLLLPSPKVSAVRSVKIEEPEEEVETLTAEELENLRLGEAGGVLWRPTSWPEGFHNINIVYEHGFTNPPGAARRAAALLARHIVTKRPSNLDDRATSMSTDEATYTLITAGIRGNLTGIPDVNAFIESWQFPTV